MDNVKVLIVEDEMIIANSIIDAVESFDYEAFGPEITYSGAIESIEKEMPSIGIFDIQLSGKKNGIDLARKVKENYKFPFVFLTSNSDKLTLDEAKLTQPSAFLLKPFNNNELYAALELALYSHSQQIQNQKEIVSIGHVIEDALFVKSLNGYLRVNYDDILYLKSDNVYIDIVDVNGKTHVVRATISEYAEKLNVDFLRIHRGYIVNLKYLEKLDVLNATIGGHKVPIGNKYKENLMSRIQKG
jgi:DNA-binding LytR/AlgR family response regulator